MHRISLLSLIFTIILSACSHRGEITDALLRADAVLCEHPDSALAILHATDTTGISDSQRAHFALLLTKSAVKCHLNIPNDSLIHFAATFYRNHNDSLEVQAYYYYGISLLMSKNYKDALPLYTEAYELAEKINDTFYQGIIARELADVYHSILMPQECLKWAMIAKEKFEKANKPVHAEWMIMSIAESLNDQLRSDEALKILSDVDTVLMRQDTVFRHLMWGTLSNSYMSSHNYDKTIEYRLKLLDEQKKLNPIDWSKLAYSYYRKDNIEAAVNALDNARKLQQSRQDSLYVFYLDALIAEKTIDFKDAYKLAMKWANEYSSSANRRITDPQTSYLIDYLNLKSKQRKTEVQQSKNALFLWSTISFLLIVILVLIIKFQRNKFKIKSAEVAELYISIKKLEQELVSDRIKNDSLKSELQTLFKTNFSQLDSLCQLWWDSSVNCNISFKKMAIQNLQELRTQEKQQQLILLINQYCENWFDRFKKDFPNLAPSQYQLAIYLFLGFSTESIAILMDKATSNAVFAAKKRLKYSILKNSAAEMHLANRYLQDLNLKSHS